jgi:glycosyltransferase involved in cell wall biosynthesis
MHILHVITSLSTGGAEIMLQKLVRALDPGRYTNSVLSLTSTSTIGGELKAAGVVVESLGGRGGVLLPQEVWNLLRVYNSTKPDLVHSWMYHANVAAHIAVRVGNQTRPPLITSIRGALHAPGAQKPISRMVRRIDARLSRSAQGIVFNSRRSARQHAAVGYDAAKAIVIPNCFDTNEFRPAPADRARIRATLGWTDNPLVGLIARFHRLKDHETFLDAARIVSDRHPGCKFLLAGRGCDSANPELMQWIAARGLSDSVRALGERRDIAAIDNALDVAVCSSMSESFPNAIGEAMACGVPGIVTDVGDCEYLVGDTGRVVPPRNATALADSILEVISLRDDIRAELGKRARERIVKEFSIERVVRQYTDLYEQCFLQRQSA